jgi:hypothetical protein
MQRKFIVGLIAATVVSWTGIVVADPGKGCEGRADDMHHHMRSAMGPGMGDPAQAAERHLARFKDELKLTPAQEPLWQAFADRVKQSAAARPRAAPEPAAALPAPERMARMNALMKERLAAMESATDAFKRLYDALTPEQQKLADRHAAHLGRMGPAPGPDGPPGAPPPG